MPADFSALTAVEAAQMFGVSEKTVRNWMNDNGLPYSGSGRGRTVKASEAIKWHHEYTRLLAGNSGSVPRNQPPNAPTESLDAAVLRKTVAEADLKELQLAKERSEVASVADVERVLAAATMATQTQILAVPSRLATRMLGIEDHAVAHKILESEMRQLLSNLATIDAVREATQTSTSEDE